MIKKKIMVSKLVTFNYVSSEDGFGIATKTAEGISLSCLNTSRMGNRHLVLEKINTENYIKRQYLYNRSHDIPSGKVQQFH